MSEGEKILQESLFEVISSEASYLKSLNILISHFVQSPTLSGPVYRDQSSIFTTKINNKWTVIVSYPQDDMSDLQWYP